MRRARRLRLRSSTGLCSTASRCRLCRSCRRKTAPPPRTSSRTCSSRTSRRRGRPPTLPRLAPRLARSPLRWLRLMRPAFRAALGSSTTRRTRRPSVRSSSSTSV
eukprot:Amastigsp_a342234_29.p3 type:complete len:105 gc:universal Amastigsp_a342234_29:551-865(+)